MEAYNKEIEQFNRQKITQIRNNIDEQFLKQTIRTANRNLTETWVESVLFYPMTHNIRHDSTAIMNVRERLKDIQNELDFAGSVDMYYVNNNLFFYGNGFFCFLDETDCAIGFRSQWLPQFRNTDAYVGWFAGITDTGTDTGKSISYVRSYPYFAPPEKRKAVFSISIDESAIRKQLIAAQKPDGGLIAIVDDQGRVISTNGDEAVVAKKINDSGWTSRLLAGKEEMFHIRIQDDEAVVASAKSGFNTWHYVSIMKKDIFYKKTYELRKWMYIVTGAFLSLGLALVYAVTKRVHSPIGKAIVDYVSQIDSLNNQLSKNEPVLKYHYMMNEFTGKDGDNSPEMSKFLQIELSGGSFFCFVLKIFGRPEKDGQIGIAASYRIIERLESASVPDCRIWAIRDPDGSVYGIVNVRAPTPLFDPIESLHAQLKRLMTARYALCVGQLYETGSVPVSVSHQEACEAAKFAFFYPDRGLLLYRDLNLADRLPTGGSVKALDELADCIRASDGKRAMSLIHKIIADLPETCYTAEYSLNFLFEIVFTIRKTVKSMGFSILHMYGYDIREQAKQLESIHEFESWIAEVIAIALSHIEERKQSVPQDFEVKLKSFIEDNLYGDISLERAAEHIGLTPNYLSRLFKFSAGVTFIEYVTERKLEEAVKLLKEKRHSVNDISAKLGYLSPNYFIRIFKLKYGQTPKQYQKGLE